MGFSNRWVFEKVNCQKCQAAADEKVNQIRIEQKKRDEEEYQRERDLRLKKMIGLRGFENYALDKFEPTFQTQDAYRAAMTFNPKKENLYLWGPAGCGKSHLAVATMRRFYGAMETMFIKHAALNRSMQGLKGNEYDLELSKYVSHQVLVVDDLGTAKRTEFSDQVLYEVLDGRYMAYQSGLIITSNLSLKDLALALGDDRLVSRIAGICKIIQMKGDDWRLKTS